MSTTPVLGLTDIEVAQAQPSVPLNANYRLLEAVIQLTVIDIVDSPPGSPADGARYIIGEGADGSWGATGDVAFFSNGGWLFATPLPGWLAYVQSLGHHQKYSDGSPSGWVLAF